MSSHGAPVIEAVSAPDLAVTIVAGTWHDTIATGLLEGARRYLERTGADVSVIRVPGSFELPLACQAALDAGADAVVALGVIVRGGTPHFEYVASATTDGLTRVALNSGKPVGFGVLTVDDEAQGIDRAGLEGSTEDKGAEAADAAVRLALTLREVGSS